MRFQSLNRARARLLRSTVASILPLLLAVPVAVGPVSFAQAQPKGVGESLVMASTTSTEQSGLFGYLLPRLTEATGVAVKVVAVGTGQALDMARRGDADMLLVHDPKAEQQFVDEGFGVARREVMYNDFVIVGPKKDPAGITGTKSTIEALGKIAAAQAPFISRGDKSGTHGAELRLWQAAAVKPPASGSGWYEESGSGMGPTLNIASAKGAYTLTDRGTWLNCKNRADLAILVEGDPVLFNQYAVILVNPQKHPHVKQTAAGKVADWLLSADGQQTIADYKLNGEPLFFPNAAAK
jgi:tungstate transport system substrate-binding protein